MSDHETYIVARSFRINGWSYEAGEVFDWNRIAVNKRKVQMLLNAGIIKTLERALKKGLVKDAEVDADVETSVETLSGDDDAPTTKPDKRRGRARK